MTHVLTRRELLRRAAAGGARAHGAGAARGLRRQQLGVRRDHVDHTLAKTLRFSNWTLYIDNEKGEPAPVARPVQEEDRHERPVHRGHQRQRRPTSGRSRGRCRAASRSTRDIIVMTDNSRYPALLIKKGWVEKLDKSAIPNIKNLQPALRHPNWDPNRDYSLPWQSGMTGIAYNDKLTEPVLTMNDLLENPKLKGKVTLLTEMARHADARDARQRRRPDEGHGRDLRQGGQADQGRGRLGPGPPVHRQRLQRAAREGRPRRACMAWSGDVVQLQADNKHLHWNLPTDGGDDLDRQHADPEGRRRLHRLGLHELRLRPEDRGADRGLRQLHLPGRSAPRRCCSRRTRRSRTTRSSSRRRRCCDNVYIFDANALSNQKYLETWQNLISA